MRIVFINPPKTDRDRENISPPFGLLKLAAVAAKLGSDICIEDFNLLWHLDSNLRASFYERATERLIADAADLYCFTSMAVDTHISIELARRLRKVKPSARNWAGGPHFSSIKNFLKELAPWFDHIFDGAAEQTFVRELRLQFGLRWNTDYNLTDIAPLFEAVHLPAYFHALDPIYWTERSKCPCMKS